MDRRQEIVSAMGRYAAAACETPRLSTGSPALDLALGGGLARGHLAEIFGDAGCGKTTLALQIAVEAQRRGGNAAFLDLERCFDPVYARALGVSADRLLLAQPESGDQALAMAEALLRSQAVDAVILDSAAALTPRTEMDASPGAGHPALHVHLLSHGVPRLVTAARRSIAALVILNQVRTAPAAGPEGRVVPVGGAALALHAPQRIALGFEPGPPDAELRRVCARVLKNRFGEPFRKAALALTRSAGFCREEELLDLGGECGAVNVCGGVWSACGVRLGATREQARAALHARGLLRGRLAAEIRLAARIQRKPPAPEAVASRLATSASSGGVLKPAPDRVFAQPMCTKPPKNGPSARISLYFAQALPYDEGEN
jgi:recombination protein RecA